MFAQLNADRTDVERTFARLPRTGKDAKGRDVSGFDTLPADVLTDLGFLPVVDDGPPEHDPTTHQAVPAGWDVRDTDVVRLWTVEPAPAEEIAEREAQEQRQADADAGLDRIAEMPGVRAKLRAVLAGNDTLTTAQVQRLVAGLGLQALKDR